MCFPPTPAAACQRFLEKVAVVVGGNSGIGLASAIALANEGARVFVTGRDVETLQGAAERIGKMATIRCCDISDPHQIIDLFTALKEELIHIDVLFVNAGVLSIHPIESVTLAEWTYVHDTNLKGVFFTVQGALPLMRSGSCIILTSSVAGREGVSGASVYAASKAGVSSLGRSFAIELAARGIRVNVVSPGPIDTPIFDRAGGVGPRDIPALKQSERESVSMKRMGSPDEVAAAVLFLASDAASFITGIDLVVAGGR